MAKQDVSNTVTVVSDGAYIWTVTAAHTIAYFIAGIFAVLFMNYRGAYASEALSCFMRPVESPLVALGPVFQLLRGVLIALILLPLRKNLFEEKHGWLRLALLVAGLSFLSTLGPTPGSFEGFIFTKLSVSYQLLGYPEALIYIFLFSFFSVAWYKKPKKLFTVLSIVLVFMIALMSFMGYLQATGVLKVPVSTEASKAG
jgi:hypothetical protein